MRIFLFLAREEGLLRLSLGTPAKPGNLGRGFGRCGSGVGIVLLKCGLIFAIAHLFVVSSWESKVRRCRIIPVGWFVISAEEVVNGIKIRSVMGASWRLGVSRMLRCKKKRRIECRR
jgi:hypothetical protein